MTKKENRILLFSITLCWASSYVFIKSLPPDLSDYGYLTMTAGIAALLLGIIFWKQLKNITGKVLLKGMALAVLLTLNLLLDKMGIDRLPASTASFLASISILIVPALMILMKKMPTKNNLAGAGIILAGILITSRFSFSGLLGAGGICMLLSALSCSVYTLGADLAVKKESPILLTIVQMVFSALFSFILWFIEDPSTFAGLAYTNQMLSSIFILAFFAKAYAYGALMFAQKYSDPISVTVIASTEPVVTLALAVLIPGAFGTGESFQTSSLLGAFLIMAGAVVSGTGFLDRKETHTCSLIKENNS